MTVLTDKMTRITTYLLGSGSVVCHRCHSLTVRIGARWLRPSPPLPSACSFQQFKALPSSPRSYSDRQWLQPSRKALPQKILFWILITGAGFTYSIHNATPLVLESEETFRPAGTGKVKDTYLPPILPFTLELANEALRREEGSRTVRAGSGVLRYDTMQLPSNPISEDDYVSASGYEEGEIKWMLFGIFDGHA